MVMTMLRRAVGEKRAYELVATGRRVIGAARRVSIGLVEPSAARDAELRECDVESWFAPLRTVLRRAQSLTKRLFYELDGLRFTDGIEAGARTNVAARATPDFRAGVERFAGTEVT